MTIESRGITCLECAGLDLKTHPERAKAGFGMCGHTNPKHFVVHQMARNCTEFVAAPADVVEARDTWAAGLVMFWQRK